MAEPEQERGAVVIVVGIDPSSYGFHAAILELDHNGQLPQQVILEHYTARDPKHPSSWPTALFLAHLGAQRLMTRLGGANAVIFIEEPPKVRNIRTLLKLGQISGAVVAGLAERTESIYQVPVDSWKKGTVGKGGASKEQVTDWLTRTHPIYAAACGASQDFVDAACIALYGAEVVTRSELVTDLGGDGEP
jgi:Holliday junction resolvasome RuvABC endonuclease subunit